MGKNDLLNAQEDLVRGLTSDHRVLFDLYKEIHGAVAARKFSAVAKHATRRLDRLHDHLALENFRLYAELKRHLEKADSEKRVVVHNLPREMFTIGHAAVDFIRQAETMVLNDGNAGKFRTDLDGVGTVLAQRIRREEDFLFPLFRRIHALRRAIAAGLMGNLPGQLFIVRAVP